MRVVALALVVMALTPLQAAAATKPLTIADIVPQFSAGSLKVARLSDQMFGALQKVLGGSAPAIRESATANSDGFHGYADPASNTVYYDPTAYAALVDENSPLHSGAVNGVPHEMMHLRQTPMVLAVLADREGGAQAFADEAAPYAARAARTYYDATRNYDGVYAPYVKQAQARGDSWIFGGQMGRAAVPFPR